MFLYFYNSVCFYIFIITYILRSFSHIARFFITDFYKGGYELLTPEFDALEEKASSFKAREDSIERFKEIGFKDEIHTYLQNWVPSLSALRDKKLEDLGIN